MYLLKNVSCSRLLRITTEYCSTSGQLFTDEAYQYHQNNKYIDISSMVQLMHTMDTSCRHHCIQTSEDPSVIQTDLDDQRK